jgi:TRAP-type C4-dicarboxylate transport system substrate-binding protein
MINGVYGSPLSVIALQWFSRMKYVFSVPIANASGAVVISKKAFDALTQEDQKTMFELGEKYFKALTAQSRKDNEESVKILKSKKLIFTEPAGTEELERAGVKARQALVGKIYSKELLEKVETALKTFRAAKKN